jgi:tetratricopeptide (TPR) repeat protein
MKNTCISLLALAGILFILAGNASAYPMDVYLQCTMTSHADTPPKRAVMACTQILSSPDTKSEKRPFYLVARAEDYIALGDWNKAYADFDLAVALSPNDAGLHNARCWAHARAGNQLPVALADCERSLVLRPGNPAALDSRGFVKFRLGDNAGAIADFDAALKQEPKMKSSLYVRGLAKKKSGDTTGGDADIAAAKAIDRKIPETYAGYGVTP